MSRIVSSSPGAGFASRRAPSSTRLRSPRRRAILGPERLEERALLATQDLGALRFSAGSFTNDGGTISASGTIEIGLVPTGAEAFNPLLEVDGSLSFVDAPTDQMFTIQDATLSSIAYGSTLPLLAATTRGFAVSDLVGGGTSLAGGQEFPVAGLGFVPDLLKLANPGDASTSDAQVDMQGSLTIPQLADLDLSVAGSSFVTIDDSGVNLTGVSVADQQFDAFGLTVKTSGFEVNFSDAGGVSTFRFSGSVAVSDDDVSFNGSLGDANTPGLVVSSGVVQNLDIGISGSIQVAGLTISANGLNYSYDASNKLYEIAGNASLSVSGTTIAADLGSADAPGLTFQGGRISQVDVGLSGSFDLFALELEVSPSNPLRLQFQRGSGTTPDMYIITGTVSVPELFDASVTLGGTGGDGKTQPGIEIVGGAFDVDGFGLSLGAVPLGAFTVQELAVTYTKDGSSFDFGATLALLFPEGWAVKGTVDFADGKVNEIDVGLNLGDTPIPIGATGLSLEAMSATVQNIAQPENLVVSGSLTVVLGDDVEIFGESVVIAQATGSFTVDKNELILDADVALAAATDSQGHTTALLGEGKGRMTLDWGQQAYSLDMSVSLLDGVFTLDAGFSFDARGDITISADADVNFPDGIPFIGGKRIGSLDFLFEYRPPQTPGGKAIGFVAAWLELDIFHKFDVGIEYDFEDRHKFSLIGTKGVNAIKAGSSNDPVTQTYQYVSSFTVPNGATIGTLSVDWPSSAAAQAVDAKVAVRPGAGAAIDQAQFSATNGLTLVTQLADSSSSVVNVVGSSADRTMALPAGEYQLILTSKVQFATPPTFQATFSYPKPTITAPALPPTSSAASIPLQLTGTVDAAFVNATTASVYLDTDGSGYDGTLIARGVPYKDGKFDTSLNLNGLLPLPYYVYAIINDGTNTPVRSAYSNAVIPTPPLTGTVGNLNNSQGLSGWTVYLDANGNGTFDPATDPFTTTGATGFYAFDASQLPVGRSIGVGVVVPNGFQFIPGSGGTNPTPVTYDGTHAVVASFNIRQLAAISGAVYNDLNVNGVRDPGEPGLSGYTLYLDANGNGRLDAGETTATSNNSGDYTFLSLPASTSFTVGLVPSALGRQTGPAPVPPGTYMATIGTDPYQQVDGQDFGVQLLGSIGGSVVGQALQDGRLAPNTTPLAGWTVQLHDASGKVVATTTSGANGSYEFGDLAPGNYTVTEVAPAGWRQITPSQADVTFKTVATPGLPGRPWWMATADFDGDGHLDLAFTTLGSGITVLFGAGDGTFPQSVTYPQPNGGGSPLVALDADGDGRPDLAVGRMILDGLSTVNAAIDLYRNNGGSDRTTLFGLASSLNLSDVGVGANGGLLDLARGDLNKDGRDDLIASIKLDAGGPTQRYFASLLSLGTTFALSASIAAPQAGGVAVGDVNNDGNLDFVNALTGAGSPGFTVHYGDGRGNFPTQVTVGQGQPGGTPSGIVALGDINGDGLLDVAAADQLGTDVAYSLQQGAGTFAPPVVFQAAHGDSAGLPHIPPRMSLADFNGDFRTDLAAFNTLFPVPQSTVSLFVNPGTTPAFATVGGLTIPLNTPGSFFPIGNEMLLSADVNGDGLRDLIIAGGNPSQVAVLLNTTAPAPGLAVALTKVGQVTTVPSFDNVQTGQVSGVVFDDVNRNGRREAGEVGRGGQVVYLDLNRNGALDAGEPTATTGANGAYAFDGLTAGAALVRLVVAPGKRITTPGADGLEITLGGPAASGADFGLGDRLINPIPSQAVSETGTLLVTATLTGAARSPLTFRLASGAPEGLRIDPRTGAISWTPGESRGPGSYSVTVFAYDPFEPALSESTTFTVDVAEVPDAIQYVSALYLTVLGRDADSSGLAFWAAHLDAGASRLDVARGFWESPEHRGVQVDSLYADYLGRQAAPQERAALVDALLSGASETAVAQSILASAKYRGTHRSATAYITGLYQDVLGRAADRAGLVFWRRAVRLGVRRAAIARRFLNSRDAFARQVDMDYRDILGRGADASGRAFWTQQLATHQQTPSQVAEMFLASPEFFDRALEGLARTRLSR